MGIGVLSSGENLVTSGLLVDNFEINPEPATLSLLAFGSLALRRRRTHERQISGPASRRRYRADVEFGQSRYAPSLGWHIRILL